eukprot:Protomagalhaensia_sp_Gyna_25__4538@NODE_417_length_3500_cov_19_680150_g320_i0_p1_GENE_NODE_417_length_3500_cov_19_680150_g320_i0NODE_417_length_3500_cov_19_680150_g320_i0_p1_ORF_typecomplete_len538_score63_02PP2C/PF00481_21/3_8e16PP2C/PF00481_21/0_00032PP2C_2/PF13672_6/6_8e07PP2C_2/PF13672_6/0_77SpoIIE/PF07228_12/0_66SpoIIE/PF07228_12/0_046_NODE_417_length_3500_cov_19_680150_g320_i017843397
MSSSTPSAAASSHLGMSFRASLSSEKQRCVGSEGLPLEGCEPSGSPDLLNEWTWTGYTANSRLIKGLSWGVSCLRTDCRENQDGWAVQVYACTDPKPHFHPSFSFSWNHELASLNSPLTPQSSAAPTKPSKPTFIGSSTFVVLDGHGAGGRDAAAAVEKAFDNVFSRTLLKNDVPARDVLTPTALLDSVGESLKVGQKMIEKLNNDTQRDFGTTCVSVTLVNDLLISTACGDSSALLLAFPRGNWSSNTGSKKPSPLVVELSRRHNLEDKEELQRIVQEGRGKVIRGDGGVLRLIPGELEYDEAKRRGLSINMGRSMGHAVFSTCGLSTVTDFSCLALRQIPKLLHSPPKVAASATRNGNRCFRLPPLSADECRRVVESFMRAAEPRRPRSEENTPSQQPKNTVSFQGARKLPEKRTSANSFSARAAFIRCLARRLPSDSPTAASDPRPATQPQTEHRHRVGDMFLLLMSDGVTDVLSSSCIVEMVKDFDLKSKSRNRPFDPAAFCLALTEMAKERRLRACQRADNCTCLAVHLIPE